MEGMRGKHSRWQDDAVRALPDASPGGCAQRRSRQADYQAEDLADAPGQGRHLDRVRGMEGTNGSIPLHILRPDHLNFLIPMPPARPWLIDRLTTHR